MSRMLKDSASSPANLICWCKAQCSPARSCGKHSLGPACCLPACEASEYSAAVPVQVQQLLLRVHWQGDCLLADLHSLSASEARAAVLCMLASMQVRLAGILVYVRQFDQSREPHDLCQVKLPKHSDYCADLCARIVAREVGPGRLRLKRSPAVLQESFRRGWKLPSLLVFIVGKGQHTQGLPKLREAVVHLLRGELHMNVIDGAPLPSRTDTSSVLPATDPLRQYLEPLCRGTDASYVASSRQLVLNPGRLAVECSSLLQWVKKARDCKANDL